VLLVWLSAVAVAHVGDVVAGIDLQADDPSQLTIEASYGLLVGQQDSFAWICHEAVTEPAALLSPRYHRTSQQTWLAWLTDAAQGRDGAPLWRSPDGCDWQAPAGTQGQVILDVASAAGEVLAAAGAGGLLRSLDDGSSFSPALSAPDRIFYTVLPGSGLAGSGETRWWATATDAAGARLFLWRLVGEDWVEQELALPEDVAVPAELKLAGVAQERAWVVVDPLGPDVLLQVEGEEVQHLDTGSPGALTDVAIDGETAWFIRDGLLLFSLQAGALQEHPAFPPGIGLDLVQGELWTAPQSQITRVLLSRSTDGGASFETLAHPDDIAAPLSCPAGSDVAEICEPLWETLLPRIRGFDSPPVDTGLGDTGELPIPPHPDDEEPAPTEPEPDKGCGCASLPSPWGYGALLGLLVTSRRRAR
jgi:hypothetical protein